MFMYFILILKNTIENKKFHFQAKYVKCKNNVKMKNRLFYSERSAVLYRVNNLKMQSFKKLSFDQRNILNLIRIIIFL